MLANPDHSGTAQRYELIERIAVGGMAEVFKAKTFGAHGFEKVLAIKRILPDFARDEEFERRFIDEAKIAVTLTHANIVQVLDFSRFGDSLYIVMEYVDGLDVARLLESAYQKDRKIPIGAALNISIEMLRALDFAHQRGVVHRDISPSNVLLTRNGAAKLADFGIAQAADGERFGAFRIVGKWPYMSPEQTRGEMLDYRSDMFSAATVLYELFTGRRLFHADSAEAIVEQVRAARVQPPSVHRDDLPEGLDELILSLLSTRREDRSISAKAVARRLVELSYKSSVPATADSVAEIVAELLPTTASTVETENASAKLVDEILSSELDSTRSRVTVDIGPRAGDFGSLVASTPVLSAEDMRRRTLPSDDHAPPGIFAEGTDASDVRRRTVLTVVRREDGIAEWAVDKEPVAESKPHPPTAVALVSPGVRSSRLRRLLSSRRALTGAVLAGTCTVVLGGFLLRGLESRVVSVAQVLAQPVADRPVVALLPFEVTAQHPDLDFAASGLPQLLGRQLDRVESIEVIGYYRLLDRISSETADMAEWELAARDLGATIFVRGTLVDGKDSVIAVLRVEDKNGALLREIRQETAVEELPAFIRSASGEVLKGFSTGELEPSGGPGFETERLFQLGIAALEKDQFTEGANLLQRVVEKDPNFGEARYHLALATWWNSVDIPEVLRHREAALAFELPADKRAFLEALEPLALNKYPDAIDAFRRAAELHPGQREILYGLFEALFHGGFPAEAVEVYRQIREASPNFRLGIMHPLSFYAARADDEGLGWALGHLQADARNRFWNVRARIARGDLDGAERLIDSIKGGIAGPLSNHERALLEHEMATLHAVTGKVELALTLVEAGNIDQRDFAGWGLGQVSGDARLADKWRKLALDRLDKAKPGYWTMSPLLEIGPLEVIDGTETRQRSLLQAIDDMDPVFGPSMGLRQLRLLLCDAVGDHAGIDAEAQSPYPVVRAEVEALQHERAGRFAEAAHSWKRATQHEGDGRFAILQAYYRARAAHRAQDWPQVLEATATIMRPGLFFWSWGSAVGPAHLWAAEALEALGREQEARVHYQAIVSLRARAGKGDALVQSAQAGLRRLR